jgi:hypothetical protein
VCEIVPGARGRSASASAQGFRNSIFFADLLTEAVKMLSLDGSPGYRTVEPRPSFRRIRPAKSVDPSIRCAVRTSRFHSLEFLLVYSSSFLSDDTSSVSRRLLALMVTLLFDPTYPYPPTRDMPTQRGAQTHLRPKKRKFFPGQDSEKQSIPHARTKKFGAEIQKNAI